MDTLWIVLIILVVIIILAIVLNRGSSRFLAFNVGDCRTFGCPANSYCGPDFKCYPGKLGDPCQESSQCLNGLFCNTGFCQPTASPLHQIIPPRNNVNTTLNAAVSATPVTMPSQPEVASGNGPLGNNTVNLGGPCRLGMRDCAPGLGCGVDQRCVSLNGNAAGNVTPPSRSSSPSPIQLLQMTPLNPNVRILPASTKPHTPKTPISKPQQKSTIKTPRTTKPSSRRTTRRS